MQGRFEVLDGWRGISILLVLAGHWLPMPPYSWLLNESVAASGMAMFFILSGFLIANLLLHNQNIFVFLTRRFLRIIPLAWLVLVFALTLENATSHQWISNFLFFANWPPMGLTGSTAHFWSLCLEMQFYVAIAVLVAILKKRAFYLVPIICIAVTVNRVYHGADLAINTYYRVDEILAGSWLALLYNSDRQWIKTAIGKIYTPLLLVLLVASANEHFGFLTYLRPYIAMLTIGSTLFALKQHWWIPILKTRFLFYIASVSYAVYVVHGVLTHTWLGQGATTLEKYAKRPLLIAATFILAHFSTFYYEKHWIALGKKITKQQRFNIKPRD